MSQTGIDRPAPSPRGDRFGDWPAPFRWTVYVVVVALVLGVAGVGAGWWVLRRSLPQTDGSLVLDDLQSAVTVRRDAAGVPQIYADSSRDLFTAQGFVQAQDRFWQMDYRRHAAAGELAEMLGPSVVDQDVTARVMGFRRVAEQELPLLDATTREALDAFSAGVNAWLSRHLGSDNSIEYSIISLGNDYRPEEWTPLDSLAWFKAMAWEQSADLAHEVDRARVAASVPTNLAPSLYPRGATDTTRGSSAVAVAGRLTASRQPMLAGTPHLAASSPDELYQTGLHCRVPDADCPYDVSGLSYAGFPGVVDGRNRSLAWSLTGSSADATDLYLEDVVGDSYLGVDGQRAKLVERTERIRVAGEPSRTITVRSTPRGPLLSDHSRVVAGAGANAPVPDGSPARGNGYAVAVHWAGSVPRPSADAVLALDRADDPAALRAAAATLSSPASGIVFAGRSAGTGGGAQRGSLGYQATGAIPVRRAGHDGTLPVPGWLPAYAPTGQTQPVASLPQVTDPPSGIVVAADQPATGQRLRTLLRERVAQGRSVSAAALNEAVTDTRSPMASVLVPYLLAIPFTSRYELGGQQLLVFWDRSQPATGDAAPAAAYFNAVWRNLLSLTFHDQLRESLWPDGSARWAAVVTALLQRPNDQWWDDTTTEDMVEDRDTILREAMRAARDDLVRRQARDPARWTWGHQHQLDRDRTGLAERWLGRVLLSRPALDSPGGNGAVWGAAWDPGEGYDVTTAPAGRLVVDLGRADGGRWGVPAGTSGHVAGPHYSDQVDAWLAGRDRSWAFSEDAVRDSTAETVRLLPG